MFLMLTLLMVNLEIFTTALAKVNSRLSVKNSVRIKLFIKICATLKFKILH